MVDLRLFANELEGKVLKPKKKMSGYSEEEGIKLRREYVIDKVYPLFVSAHTTTENGEVFKECFSVGDLVQLGLIDTVRPRYGSPWV